MRKLELTVIVGLLLAAAPGADAELEPRLGGKLVYDTDLNITWLADGNLPKSQGRGLASPSGAMRWDSARQYLALMNKEKYLGVSTWRFPRILPGCAGYDCTYSELGHLFYLELGGQAGSKLSASGDPDLVRFGNIEEGGGTFYWGEMTGGSNIWSFSFSGGFQAQRSPSFNEHQLWPVFDGDIANIIKPSSLRISPPTGEYIVSQHFDFVLILRAPDHSVVSGSVSYDGADVTGIIVQCARTGVLSAGGTTYRCPGIAGADLGQGDHTLTVTLQLTTGETVRDTVSWRIVGNVE